MCPLQIAAGGTGCGWDDGSCVGAATVAGSGQSADTPSTQAGSSALSSRGQYAQEYQPVRHSKHDHQLPMPPAFMQRGLLQLGRFLNAPFRSASRKSLLQTKNCHAPSCLALTGVQVTIVCALAKVPDTSCHRVGFQVAAGWQARGAAAAAGCRRGGADVPHPGGALPRRQPRFEGCCCAGRPPRGEPWIFIHLPLLSIKYTPQDSTRCSLSNQFCHL